MSNETKTYERFENSAHMKDIINKLYHRIGLRFGFSDDVIQSIIESQYEFVKKELISIDFNSIENEDQFNKLKTNFMFKYFGKLHTKYSIVYNLHKNVQRLNEGKAKKKNK